MTSVIVPSTAYPAPADASEKAHHQPNGVFKNPWPSFQMQDRWKIFKWLIGSIFKGERPNTNPPNIPTVTKPVFLETRSIADEKFRATWLGHACYLVEFPGGFRALFDPVLCQRCSPFTWMGPARYTEAPCQIEDIPVVDAVVISHSHYDHLSLTDVKKIQSKHPNAHFFVPLGNQEWFAKCGIKNCTEMDWWDSREVSISLDKEDSSKVEAVVHCLPCQHTAARTPFDRDHTLWSSWGVSSGGKSVYFAGDTGYRRVPTVKAGVDDWGEEFKDLPVCPAFKQIGEHRGPFDLGLIPIGAYAPREIMSSVHANPFDSVNIFLDTRCHSALAMHWGTWVLTNERVMEPVEKLQEAKKRFGVADGDFTVIGIGESKEF